MTEPAESDAILPTPPIAFRPPSALFAVVCANGRVCQVLVMRGRQVAHGSPDDARVVAAELDEDASLSRCHAGPHRVVEYVPKPEDAPRLSRKPYEKWVFVHPEGDFCRWPSNGSVVEYITVGSDDEVAQMLADDAAKSQDRYADCGVSHIPKRLASI